MAAPVIVSIQPRYRRGATLAVIAAALLTAVAFARPDAAAAPAPATLASVPLAGSYIDVEGATGTFDGKFAGKRLVASAGKFQLEGMLSMTLHDPSGRAITSLEQEVTLPVTNLTTTPSTLELVLGPGRVIVVGMQVYFDQALVEVEAEDGAANQLALLLAGPDDWAGNNSCP